MDVHYSYYSYIEPEIVVIFNGKSGKLIEVCQITALSNPNEWENAMTMWGCVSPLYFLLEGLLA